MKKLSKSRERVNEARKVLANLTDEQKAHLLASGQLLTVDGKRLSEYNTMLVFLQFSRATVVGGFNQWKQSGRKVRKGSAGLSIWVPAGKKDEDDLYFFAGTVFDISQTEPIEELIEA